MNTLITKLFWIILFSPLLIIGVLIFIVNVFTVGFPILHVSHRTGKNEIPFKFYKFRTLKIESKQYFIDPLGEEIYVNRFTKIIRKFKLDEIPQLINFIKSDMNIFGHRPLLHNQIDFLPLSIRKSRSLVKPGLFGDSILSSESQLERIQLDFVKKTFFKKVNIFYKTIRNLTKLEKNKDTLKWDDFYLMNKLKLFKNNYSLIYSDGFIELFSIEKGFSEYVEELNEEIESEINNSSGIFSKTIPFLLTVDKNFNSKIIDSRFKIRTFYFDKDNFYLYYFISKTELYLAKKLAMDLDTEKISLEIMDLIVKKEISINFPLKLIES